MTQSGVIPVGVVRVERNAEGTVEYRAVPCRVLHGSPFRGTRQLEVLHDPGPVRREALLHRPGPDPAGTPDLRPGPDPDPVQNVPPPIARGLPKKG